MGVMLKVEEDLLSSILLCIYALLFWFCFSAFLSIFLPVSTLGLLILYLFVSLRSLGLIYVYLNCD